MSPYHRGRSLREDDLTEIPSYQNTSRHRSASMCIPATGAGDSGLNGAGHSVAARARFVQCRKRRQRSVLTSWISRSFSMERRDPRKTHAAFLEPQIGAPYTPSPWPRITFHGRWRVRSKTSDCWSHAEISNGRIKSQTVSKGMNITLRATPRHDDLASRRSLTRAPLGGGVLVPSRVRSFKW